VQDPLRGDRPVPVRTDVLAVTLDDSLLLYDAVSSRAHVLNHSAARIWGMLAAASLDEAVASLAAESGRSEADLVDDVRGTVERFRSEGLLGPSPVPSAPPTAVDAWQRIDRPTGAAPTLAMLDRTVAVTSSSPDVLDVLDWFGEPTRTREPPGETYRLELDPAETRTLPSRLNRLASASAAFVVVHAAGVVYRDAVVALAAGPGAGKSTLATQLVADGAGYVTDEVLGIAPHSLAVAGYSKRITLEIGSWSLFPWLDAIASRSAREGLDPTRVRWLDPRDVRPGALDWRGHSLHLGLIVVPHYREGVALAVEPLTALDTLLELVTDCFNLATVGERGLEALRDVARSVPAYRVIHADVRAASATVRDLAARHGLLP
jgi:hypothetical protein